MTQTPRSDEDDQFDVAGMAARTRIREYRPNARQETRALQELLNWAAESGLKVPEYAKVEVDEEFQPTRNGLTVDAKYYEFQGAFPDELIYWSSRSRPQRSIVDQASGVVVINLAPDVRRSDERFLHVLAHEVYELRALKDLFDQNRGQMAAERLYALTEPLTMVRNLHWHAWEQADSFIERLREVAT